MLYDNRATVRGSNEQGRCALRSLRTADVHTALVMVAARAVYMAVFEFLASGLSDFGNFNVEV